MVLNSQSGFEKIDNYTINNFKILTKFSEVSDTDTYEHRCASSEASDIDNPYLK